MIEWSAPAVTSPPRRFSSSNSASILWKSQYSEPHGNIWNSCASLQPSASIWGPQIKSTSQPFMPNHTTHTQQKPGLSVDPQFASPKSTANSNLGQAVSPVSQQRRLSSTSKLGGLPCVTSAASSASTATASSPLWFEDPYLVSPPPSPETLANGGSSPVSITNISPFHSPTVAAATLSNIGAPEEFTISSTSGPLYFVQFKGDRVDVFTAPGTFVYNVGEAVMVDADRGRDLGTIIAANVSRRDAAALKRRQSQERQTALHTNGCGASGTSNSSSASNASSASSDAALPTVYNPKQILAVASASEISDMVAKTNDEASAVNLCNKKAAERHLDMKIVDAEYQWDRRKLTFFYKADTRVDFRDLVRELFRIYKTRIWMCATNARS